MYLAEVRRFGETWIITSSSGFKDNGSKQPARIKKSLEERSLLGCGAV
jgi:hypothetical protein